MYMEEDGHRDVGPVAGTSTSPNEGSSSFSSPSSLGKTSGSTTPIISLGKRVVVSRPGRWWGDSLLGREWDGGVGLGIGTGERNDHNSRNSKQANGHSVEDQTDLSDLFSFSDPKPLGGFDPYIPRLSLPKDESVLSFEEAQRVRKSMEAVEEEGVKETLPLPSLARDDSGSRTEDTGVDPQVDKPPRGSRQPSSPSNSTRDLSRKNSFIKVPTLLEKGQKGRVQRKPSRKETNPPCMSDRKSSLEMSRDDELEGFDTLQNQQRPKGLRKFFSNLKVKSAKSTGEGVIKEAVRPTMTKRFSRSFSSKGPAEARPEVETTDQNRSFSGPGPVRPELPTPLPSTRGPQTPPRSSRHSHLTTDSSPALTLFTTTPSTPLESQTWSPDEAMVAAYSQASIFLSQDPTIDRPKRRALPHDGDSPTTLAERGRVTPLTPETIETLPPLPLKSSPVESYRKHRTSLGSPHLEKEDIFLENLYISNPPASKGSPKSPKVPISRSNSSTPQSKHDVYADFDKPLPNLGFVLRHGPRDTFAERPLEAPQKPLPDTAGGQGNESRPEADESTWPPRSASPTKRPFLSRLGAGGRPNEIDQAGITGKGSLFTDFAIIRQLGVGSFGTVFKAKWLIHGNYGTVTPGGPGQIQKAEDDDQGVIIAVKRLDKDYPNWEKAKSHCIELKVCH